MTKIVIVMCALVGLALGLPEKPAPYPAKGWKPQGARLELPTKYGPPAQPDDIEITTLTNEYIPATTEYQNDENDVLRVQGLPAADAISQFQNFQQKKSNTKSRSQVARLQMAPAPAFAGQPLLLSPLFAPQFAPVNGQLREMQFGQQQQVQEFDSPKNDVQQLSAAQTYGPPKTNIDVPQERADEPEVQQNEQPEQPQAADSEEDYDEEQEDSVESTIVVSNVGSSGNLVQASQQGQVGQYYILLPDSSLQKVRFATKQTVEDREINGFSAQLR